MRSLEAVSRVLAALRVGGAVQKRSSKVRFQNLTVVCAQCSISDFGLTAAVRGSAASVRSASHDEPGTAQTRHPGYCLDAALAAHFAATENSHKRQMGTPFPNARFRQLIADPQMHLQTVCAGSTC